ncbi:Probable bifunctional SAT/APS kinase [Chlamydia abortus]|uniref:Adenylyl-sulfate kinase n=1 Tax=Paenibacillus residui TaxID=629724 RepID=A0ABW3D4W5_9BACL|nr:Probable bifunctional SAT/APS kinase [Chlamydia abortus]
MSAGVTVWFTGLSGAGKTTLCGLVKAGLIAAGARVEVLDGDDVRRHLAPDLGFSREDRMKNIERAAFVARLLSRNGVIVLASFITPYQSMRNYLRQELDPYIEVYVRCSLKECIRRDVKGLYRKALRGEVPRFTGISDEYEEPVNPDVTVDTEQCSKEEGARLILDFLRRRSFI